MDKELHHAAVTALCRVRGFCLSSNRDSQTEAWGIQKPTLLKDQEQCSAQQGRQQNKGNGWDRVYFPPQGTAATCPCRHCPPSPGGAFITKPTVHPGCGAGTDPVDPRSCFWAALTKRAIMHTSFHIYAKSIHPTRISTVFEAL